MKINIKRLCESGDWCKAINVAKDQPDELILVGQLVLSRLPKGVERDRILWAIAARLGDLREVSSAEALLDGFLDRLGAEALRKTLDQLFRLQVSAT